MHNFSARDAGVARMLKNMAFKKTANRSGLRFDRWVVWWEVTANLRFRFVLHLGKEFISVTN